MPRRRKIDLEILPPEDIAHEIFSFEIPPGYQVPIEKGDKSFIRRYGIIVHHIGQDAISKQQQKYSLWYCLCSRSCIRKKQSIRMYRGDATGPRRHLDVLHNIRGKMKI